MVEIRGGSTCGQNRPNMQKVTQLKTKRFSDAADIIDTGSEEKHVFAKGRSKTFFLLYGSKPRIRNR